jgi:adenosylcobinamide-phosphate synthase
MVVGAVVLDWLLGEPRRAHPLVGFGRLTQAVETVCYGWTESLPEKRRLQGVFGLLILLLPFTAAALALSLLPIVGELFSLSVLTFTISHKSLQQHARAVIEAQQAHDEAQARRCAAMMVSRDPAALEVNKATVESVLENGNDGIFGAIFWFVVAGAPGCLFYRLANTLDAMWGYRNKHYEDFGWAAARLDDLLNYLPARLTALSYALVGQTHRALHCWRHQAAAWESPNAGPVMAAGAGALQIVLGGPARYQGAWHKRPILGEGPSPQTQDIERALDLVSTSLVLWLALLLLGGLFHA